MNHKSLFAAAALSLVVAGCSSDTSVTTTVVVSPTTSADTTTSVSEATSTTAPPTTTTAPPTTTTAPETLTIDIVYVSGAIEGGGRVEVPLGEPVVIRIDSDTVDEGHLHGYDIHVDVGPGDTGVIEFVADIPGIFELELESAGVLLADLEVAP